MKNKCFEFFLDHTTNQINMRIATIFFHYTQFQLICIRSILLLVSCSPAEPTSSSNRRNKRIKKKISHYRNIRPP